LSRVALFLLSCIWLPPIALAQTDIPVSQIGPYITVGRGLAWGAVGVGGINNGFVFTPYQADTGVCISIFNNNPTSIHSFGLSVYVAIDPSAVGVISNQAFWTNIYTSTTQSVGTTALAPFWLKTAGSAKVEIVISGSTTATGTPDTADIIVAEAQTGCASVGAGSGTLQSSQSTNPGTSFGSSTRSGILCDQTTTIKVPTGTTVQVAASPIVPIHVCAYAISGPITTTSADLSFRGTTAGVCTGSSATPVWVVTTDVNVPNYVLSDAQGQLFQQAHPALCFTNGGTGSTITLSVNWTVF
jgi:hypothetical protein